MTQHSNREPYAPWGEPVQAKTTGWWTPLLNVRMLMRHVVIMFTAMAVITAINLITTPTTWWSLALLVIWVAVVIIHGLGIVSIGVLLDEDEAPRQSSPPRSDGKAEPQHGPPAPGWITRRRDESQPAAPVSWELKDDPPSGWPEAPPETGSIEREEPATDRVVREEPATEQVSWRAVTDIAWLRQPRGDAARNNGSAPQHDREASS
ncbi:MAG: hypothetical protein M3173_09840 [Chloroflexota bacterium]|nr:hypothetical protein [Chloroflexota bacterium]